MSDAGAMLGAVWDSLVPEGLVIWSASEQGFWSNEQGWVSLSGATRFSHDDRPMPHTRDGDAELVEPSTMGECDGCGTPYVLSSTEDHDAEEGTCWGCSPRRRVTLPRFSIRGDDVVTFADGKDYFLTVNVPGELYLSCEARYARWPVDFDQARRLLRRNDDELLCFVTADEGTFWVRPEHVIYASLHDAAPPAP